MKELFGARFESVHAHFSDGLVTRAGFFVPGAPINLAVSVVLDNTLRWLLFFQAMVFGSINLHDNIRKPLVHRTVAVSEWASFRVQKHLLTFYMLCWKAAVQCQCSSSFSASPVSSPMISAAV